MANVGYVNKAVQAMYGIPYNQLTAEQKRILHEDSVRRAKLIEERQKAVIQNNLKAFKDEARMEKVLASIYSQCQKEILADVTETIAKVKKAGGEWSYANQSALTRSRGLFEQISKELTKLGQSEQAVFTQGLSNIYTDQFMRQVYTLGQSMTVKANFNRLNPALVKKTLEYPWSGAMFSDRLWLDKETLGRNLRAGLTQSMILGESIPQITDRINKGIDTSRYNAERIARTETKRVTYCAHNDVYEDTGVDELEYRCANGVDARTCAICSADNGKHYKRGEEPTLPRHPNCRCVYIPVVSDTFGDNELNELTGSVRGAENYEKWKEAELKKQSEAKAESPKKAKAVNKNEDKYNEELNKLDSEYKAKDMELTTMKSDYDTINTQYTGYSTVRRGFLTPEEAGFKNRLDFDTVDNQLTKQMKDLQKKIDEVQAELKDIMRDRQYLLKVGAEKVDTFEDFKVIRSALRKNRTFDYDNYVDDLIEAISVMDPEQVALQKAFYKNGSTAMWRGLNPTEVFKDGAISDVRLSAKTSSVAYKKVDKLEDVLTEEEIISKLAGGDMTSGSCSSLGFAYIGNKNGFDVTDFRGGKSQEFFSMNSNIKSIVTLPNVSGKVVSVQKEIAGTMEILNNLEIGKEYYIAVGRHASIVRRLETGAVEYLEMQSRYENGWTSFDRYGSMATTLAKRFGCRKTVDRRFGMVWEKDVVIVDVDAFAGNDEFEKILGYINTATDKQKKGATGNVK